MDHKIACDFRLCLRPGNWLNFFKVDISSSTLLVAIALFIRRRRRPVCVWLRIKLWNLETCAFFGLPPSGKRREANQNALLYASVNFSGTGPL